MVCAVGQTGCRSGVKTIDQLQLALQARGLTVERVEPTADEKRLMEKFRAMTFGLGVNYEEFVTLRIDGVEVEVTRYSGSMKARSEVKDQNADEAQKARRKLENHERYDPTLNFSNGAFMFSIKHWTVSAAPGGTLDMGSYRSLDIDPAVEQRIESTVTALKL